MIETLGIVEMGLWTGIGTVGGAVEPMTREAEATREWAALLLAMLLSAVVLIGSMVMVLYLKRRWRPSIERRVDSVPVVDAWAEAGRRAETPTWAGEEPTTDGDGDSEADG